MPTDCAASFDGLRVVPKPYLVDRLTSLSSPRLAKPLGLSGRLSTAERCAITFRSAPCSRREGILRALCDVRSLWDSWGQVAGSVDDLQDELARESSSLARG
jgi:hypothetical protein